MLAVLSHFYSSILPHAEYIGGGKAPKTQLHALPSQESSVGNKVK